MFRRGGEELLRISAGKAEIQIAGGRLFISEGAEITVLGTTQRVDNLMWKLPGNKLFLNGAPISEHLALSIWPHKPQEAGHV